MQGQILVFASMSATLSDHCFRTIKTPQILELSGIGGPDILKRIGVPLKIDLPGVGENVQDHLLFCVSLSKRYYCRGNIYV